MKKKFIWYAVFFILLIAGFWYFLFAGTDYYKAKLPVLSYVKDFTFTNQNGKQTSQRDMAGKVYVTEYFFTTCKGICPKMNENMLKIYKQFKNEPDFAIISHTSMPETDSVFRLKEYSQKLLATVNGQKATNNWLFVTGTKDSLYKMARESYLLDDEKNNSGNIKDQFIHTQFFALVDKEGRVRGVYDGLKNDELDKLSKDITDVLKEKKTSAVFNSTFTNNPS
jgi:protein SCO1/2